MALVQLAPPQSLADSFEEFHKSHRVHEQAHYEARSPYEGSDPPTGLPHCPFSGTRVGHLTDGHRRQSPSESDTSTRGCQLWLALACALTINIGPIGAVEPGYRLERPLQVAQVRNLPRIDSFHQNLKDCSYGGKQTQQERSSISWFPPQKVTMGTEGAGTDIP